METDNNSVAYLQVRPLEHMRISIFIFAWLALSLSGCSKPEYIQQREQCESEGWHYCETLGTASDDGKLLVWMSSENSEKVDVGVGVGGKRVEKSYPQKEYIYKGCIFLKPSGDSFALVFRKDKPKPLLRPSNSLQPTATTRGS